MKLFKNPYILSLLFLVLFFQAALQGSLPIVRYLDELITILALIIIIKSRSLNRRFRRIIILLVLVVVVGLEGGNYVSKIQTDVIPIINDVGNCTKVFVTFMGSYIYFKNINIKTFFKFLLLTRYYVTWIIIVAIFLCLVNFFIDIGMSSELRLGIPSYKFVYNGPAIFSNILYLLIPLLIMYLCFLGGCSKRNILLLAGFLFLLISTLRTRAFLFAIVFLFLYWWVIIKKQSFKINIVTISIGIGVFAMVCLDQIMYYVGEDMTARAALLFGGIQTMIDFFPFGAGFSTFGTDAAAKYYSPLYEEYGIDTVYGLTPDEHPFASDSFWPAIIGQFGVIGFFLYILLIYHLFAFIFRICKTNRYYSLMGIFICFVLIVDSTASSAFFHFLTVNLMFLLGICLNGSRFVSSISKNNEYTHKYDN